MATERLVGSEWDSFCFCAAVPNLTVGLSCLSGPAVKLFVIVEAKLSRVCKNCYGIKSLQPRACDRITPVLIFRTTALPLCGT